MAIDRRHGTQLLRSSARKLSRHNENPFNERHFRYKAVSDLAQNFDAWFIETKE